MTECTRTGHTLALRCRLPSGASTPRDAIAARSCSTSRRECRTIPLSARPKLRPIPCSAAQTAALGLATEAAIRAEDASANRLYPRTVPPNNCSDRCHTSRCHHLRSMHKGPDNQFHQTRRQTRAPCTEAEVVATVVAGIVQGLVFPRLHCAHPGTRLGFAARTPCALPPAFCETYPQSPSPSPYRSRDTHPVHWRSCTAGMVLVAVAKGVAVAVGVVGVAARAAGSVATMGVVAATAAVTVVGVEVGLAAGAEAGVEAVGSAARCSSRVCRNRSDLCQRRSTSSPTRVRRRRNVHLSSCPPCRRSKNPCRTASCRTRHCVVAAASERGVAEAVASERGAVPLEAVPAAASLAASAETRRVVRAESRILGADFQAQT